MHFNPTEVHPHFPRISCYYGGTQKIFRFENGYGASVVSEYVVPEYEVVKNRFELAVLDDKGKLCYTTPITDDVIRYQTEDQIQEILMRIAGL